MKLKLKLRRALLALLSLGFTAFFMIGCIIIYFELQLPNVSVLKNVQLQVPLKIYSANGQLIGEYGSERRNPVDLTKVPKRLIDAVLATEDQRFYEHPGVDIFGLVRAGLVLITTGKKVQGGSTITMQVARNFFLTRKKTFTRKIKEILLALKIDREFSKDKVLELYLNKIYFGNRAYGIAAASQVYYGKPLNELTLPQLAMLAGLPKAPSAINPLANPTAAKDRRDHVLERMYDHHYIDQQTYTKASHAPLSASYHRKPITLKAHYVAEMVRDTVVAHYGPSAYTEGLKVYTTIQANTQKAANKAIHDALIAYDHRHGYRGPLRYLGTLKNAETVDDWIDALKHIQTYNGLIPAVVTQVGQQRARAVLGNGDHITIPWKGLQWARKALKNGHVGAKPQQASDILKVGDVIRVQQLNNKSWELAQIPQVEGALVAIDPKDGAILALTGGFDYSVSNFNRVTQAQRQPGSSFKPFIYAAALAKGYTLASMINDAPVVVNDPSEETLWRPENDTRRFYGPTRLRVGLTKSRNLVSIRLLENISTQYAVDYAARFGFNPHKLPKTLSLALGSALVTPLQLATGYAVFANGGYKIQPYLIAKITDTQGQLIYQADPKRACESCASLTDPQQDNPIPSAERAPRVISAQVAYLMTQAMRDVIRYGTGRRALSLHRTDLAGKTGTTNKKLDAWFSGFNSNIVATAWVGFDKPHSLHEYGAQAALPMWIEFMGMVLKNKPEATIPTPPNIVTVRIDPKTGLLARENQKNAIFEVFRKQDVPKRIAPSQQQATQEDSTSPDQPLF